MYPEIKLPGPLPTVVVKTRDGREKKFILTETLLTKGYSDKVEYIMGDSLKESSDDVVSIEIYYPKNDKRN